MTETLSAPRETDVRALAPMQRHARIFDLVGRLQPGEALVLVNDHGPKPLHDRFEAEHPNIFSWTYLERGPGIWRVEIGRIADATA